MAIEGIRLKNFKAFQDVKIEKIPKMCVFVGANGTGKITLFNAFSFLQDTLTDNLRVALTKLGGGRGFQEVRSRNSTGPIEIELKFRKDDDSPLVTYSLTINEEDGRPVIQKEILKYRRGSSGKPWQFLNFSKSEGLAVINERDTINDIKDLKREKYELKFPDILALKGLAQFENFPASKAIGDLLENWHISDFHIQQARPERESGYAEHLSKEGENLALVTEFLYQRHPKMFKTILEKLKQRVPGIDEVNSKITEEGRVLLRFKDGDFQDPFLARYVSDGTIKMLAYLVLFYDPKPHPLVTYIRDGDRLGYLWRQGFFEGADVL